METLTTPTNTIAAAQRAAADLPPPIGLGKVYRHDEAAQIMRLPLYGCSVPAGFPSPADDHLRQVLSLDEHCVRRPAATFYVEVVGTSMIDANIYPGDILVVDRSITAAHGHIVVAVLDGEHTVKRLWSKNGKTFLKPANPAFQPIEVKDGQEFLIWGVVAWILHKGPAV